MTNVCVLSGGGAKGAFQVGALQHLILSRNLRFDAFFGVSTGALSGAFMACAMQDEQPARIGELASLYLDLKSDRAVFDSSRTVLGKAYDVLFGRGVYNPKPLRRLIDKHIDIEDLRDSGVHFGCQVVNLSAGRLVTVDNTPATPNSTLSHGILASAIEPAIMVPEQDWVDGGVRNITPLAAAFDWLKYKHKPVDMSDVINFWVILCQHPSADFVHAANFRGWEQALRAVSLLMNEVWLGDIREAISRNRSFHTEHPEDITVELKFILPMTADLGDSLDFSTETVRRRLRLGVEAAESYLTQSEMWEEINYA